MLEFTPLSVIIGLLIGIGLGIVHGIYKTYSSAYDKSAIGDDSVDALLNYNNAKRQQLSDNEIKASFSNTRRKIEEKENRKPIFYVMVMLLPMLFPFVLLVGIYLFGKMTGTPVVINGTEHFAKEVVKEATEVVDQEELSPVTVETDAAPAKIQLFDNSRDTAFQNKLLLAVVQEVSCDADEILITLEVTNKLDEYMICETNAISIDNHSYKADGYSKGSSQDTEFCLAPKEKGTLVVRTFFDEIYYMDDSFMETVNIHFSLETKSSKKSKETKWQGTFDVPFNLDYELREADASEQKIYAMVSYNNHEYEYYSEDENIIIYKLVSPAYYAEIDRYLHYFFIVNKSEEPIWIELRCPDISSIHWNSGEILSGTGGLFALPLTAAESDEAAEDSTHSAFQVKQFNAK